MDSKNPFTRFLNVFLFLTAFFEWRMAKKIRQPLFFEEAPAFFRFPLPYPAPSPSLFRLLPGFPVFLGTAADPSPSRRQAACAYMFSKSPSKASKS